MSPQQQIQELDPARAHLPQVSMCSGDKANELAMRVAELQ